MYLVGICGCSHGLACAISKPCKCLLQSRFVLFGVSLAVPTRGAVVPVISKLRHGTPRHVTSRRDS
ncbi:hypothetical protein PAXRUDRAFT_509223 [Paxillus rubicundulus Ve08.2h10]|uniref:Uncharacterized protein n=1 Tax=Paxillus rubicundulus Ve08.2h10 TaxID=930991 RepID=A0A0D0CVF4_9AGAM|nr:hypothetical protein PAXRUDRAFT_509223 [Paxillus rubicundulus Ve08.2h10]